MWNKHEPVKIGEEGCKISTAPSTGPSTRLTARFGWMKININFIVNRLRGISQAAVISVPADIKPTFRTGAIGGEGGR